MCLVGEMEEGEEMGRDEKGIEVEREGCLSPYILDPFAVGSTRHK